MGESFENCVFAPRVCVQKYPYRDHPNWEVFKRLFRIFSESASVTYCKQENRNKVTANVENKFMVFGSLVEN